MKFIIGIFFLSVLSILSVKSQVKEISILPSDDTYVFESCSSCTNGSSATLTTGYYSYPGQFYILFKFDFIANGIPTNAVITKAELELTSESGPTSITDNAMTIKYLTSTWDETDCNNTIYSGLGKGTIRIKCIKSGDYNENGLKVDLRELTQYWVGGDIENDGFVINYSGSLINFFSKEATNANYRPKLKIRYFIPDETISVNHNVTVDGNNVVNTAPYNLMSIAYGSYYNCLSFINFDMSGIDVNKGIVAYLELSGCGHSSTQYSGIELYPVESYWTESSITWNGQSNYSYGSPVNLPPPEDTYQDYLVNISKVISDYKSGGFSSFHGFKIQKEYTGNYDYSNFYTLRYPDNCPKIYIAYYHEGNIPNSAPVNVTRSTRATPSSDENYILEITPRVEMQDLSEFSSTADLDEKITYFDGLGRPKEEIAVASTPLGNDVIKPIVYDDFGRIANDYLPFAGNYADGSFRDFESTGDDVLGQQEQFYEDYLGESSYTYAYSRTIYESSPLNRILDQGSPGEVWQPDESNPMNRHTRRFEYLLNDSYDNIIIWQVTNSGIFQAEGYYNGGELYKNVLYDEEDHVSVEYKDGKGNVILNERFDDENYFRTYYVYDDFNLLRGVIPPQLSDEVTSSTTFNPQDGSGNFYELGYYYEYDGRKRLTTKKLPGADPVYMIYDDRDRLIFSQDGKQRVEGFWHLIKYDELNRPVITGRFQDSETSGELLASFNANSTNINEQRNSSNYGYTSNTYPTNNYECLTITYYDDYNFPSQMDANFDYSFHNTNENISTYQDDDGNTDGYFDRVCGQVTGMMTKVLGSSNDWIKSVMYYDDKYQVIQTIKSAYPIAENSYTLTSTDYTFTGDKNAVYIRQTVGSETNSLRYDYTYDHSGRLLETYQTVNDNEPVIISHLNYDELGKLEEKNLFSPDQLMFFQSEDFKYNIRGWLTEINDPDDLNSESDLFGMRLHYNTSPVNLSNTACYNGNISSMEWTHNDGSSTLTKLCYNYHYDELNRITGGDSHQNVYDTWYDATIDVSYGYDKNGNITSIHRKNWSGTKPFIDYLTLNYNGNKLIKVIEDPYFCQVPNLGFIDGADLSLEYLYDKNGNMTRDYNKGIDEISYNYLNLPETLASGTDQLQFTNDASGTKLKKNYQTSAITWTTEYNDNFVYKDGKLSYILFEEGLIDMSNEIPEYNLFLKDHLGNTRVVFNDQGFVTQRNDYYPFGMEIPGRRGGDVKNRYNGKELQDDMLGNNALDWYDYGKRFYDPAIGRWHSIDPLSEQSRRWSPYQYAYNNPIRFIDPDGMMPLDWIKNLITNKYEWRDDVTKPSETPEGYAYIGPRDNDILNDLNIPSNFEIKDFKRVGVGLDGEAGKGAVPVLSFSNVSGNLQVKVAVSHYNKNNLNEHNKYGKTFEGITFYANFSQQGISANSNYLMSYEASLLISDGQKVYWNHFVNPPKWSEYLWDANYSIRSTNMHFSAQEIYSRPLLKATISAGMSNPWIFVQPKTIYATWSLIKNPYYFQK